jgi:hypothetical protein
MPTQPKDAKPPRMYGVVPTPYEIPPEHLPISTRPEEKRPLFVRIIVWFCLYKVTVYSFLALVPWTDPKSAVASFLIAKPLIVFSLLPRTYQLPYAFADRTNDAFLEALPFFFLFLTLVYLFSAWRYWTLNKFWTDLLRFAIMFLHGATVARTLIALSTRYVGAAEAPLSHAMRLSLFIMIVWNFFIFCCFAYYPRIEDAYDTKA